MCFIGLDATIYKVLLCNITQEPCNDLGYNIQEQFCVCNTKCESEKSATNSTLTRLNDSVGVNVQREEEKCITHFDACARGEIYTCYSDAADLPEMIRGCKGTSQLSQLIAYILNISFIYNDSQQIDSCNVSGAWIVPCNDNASCFLCIKTASYQPIKCKESGSLTPVNGSIRHFDVERFIPYPQVTTSIVTTQNESCPDQHVVAPYLDSYYGTICLQLFCTEGFILKDNRCFLNDMERALVCKDYSNISYSIKLMKLNREGYCKEIEEYFSTVMQDFQYFPQENIECKILNDELYLSYTATLGNSELNNNFQQNIDLIIRQIRINIPLIFSSSNLAEWEITKECESDVQPSCDPIWVAVDDSIFQHANKTNKAFMEMIEDLFNTDQVMYKLQYGTQGMLIYKNVHMKICAQNQMATCPLVMLNSSLFETTGPSNDSLRFIPDGRIFNSTEFMKTSDKLNVKLCNFLNQSRLIAVQSEVVFLKYSKNQMVVSIVGNTISSVTLLFCLVTYGMFSSLRNHATILIMNLMIALLMCQILLLLGGNQPENTLFCSAVAIVSHYACLANFTWMNVVAFDLNKTFGNTRRIQAVHPGEQYMKVCIVIGWISPLFIVVPCTILYLSDISDLFSYGKGGCWITDGISNLVGFGIPVAISLLFNLVLFCHTVSGIRSTNRATACLQEDSTQRKQSKRELMIYIKVIIWYFQTTTARAAPAATTVTTIIYSSNKKEKQTTKKKTR